MSSKEIINFLSVFPAEREEPFDASKPHSIEVQEGNVSFRTPTLQRTIQCWDTNTPNQATYIKIIPWKQSHLLNDADVTVGHSFLSSGVITNYPIDISGQALDVYDFRKFRATKTTTGLLSTDMPLVLGGVGAHNQFATLGWQQSDTVISVNNVPLEYTQIGIVYQHPMVVGGSDITTVVGASYITFANSHYLDNVFMEAHVYNMFRIGSGADAGLYFVRFVDRASNRLYLTNLDGSLFVGQANASGLPWYTGPGRRAYFNEVSILQLGTGTIATGGYFRPGQARNSFILRVVFDKTGSDASAVGAEQQGSYYVTMTPYTRGQGLGIGGAAGQDQGAMSDPALLQPASGGVLPTSFNFYGGGVSGHALDEVANRLWYAYTNVSGNSGIAYWNWKTVENFREIANYAGTGAHKTFVTPSLVLGAGDLIRDVRMGPARTTYITIGHASGGNAGLAVIKSDLTTLQYNIGSGFPDYRTAGSGLDSSRARVGTANDVTTTVATDQVNSASGAFTAADIGRVIRITGGTNNAGTYKVATVPSGTQVTVVTTAGAAVSFGAGGTGGTFEIGERLYLFFANATTGAGKINYMESLLPGTFYTRVVAMTNGANCSTAAVYGEYSKISVDRANGNVYWLSNDTQQQINKYDVTANSHSFLTVADVQAPSGGTGSITSLTVFTAIKVNSKFDEIWVGTDQGHVKVIKSTFAAATAKRYFGTETTTYANPAGFFRSQGADNTSYLYVRNYAEHPDGRITSVMMNAGQTQLESTCYSREADTWIFKDLVPNYQANQAATTVANWCFDSIGNAIWINPQQASFGNGGWQTVFTSVEVQYQWDNANSRWIPLEVAQGPLPNKSVSDTSNPGCLCKPIHSTLDDVLYGVKIAFTKQGGATPANNEFLGRAGQTTLTLADGATTIGTATFNGSGFVSGDVGKLLHLESGADAGVYKITVFNSSTSLTIAKLNGSAVTAAATASSLNYTLWSTGTAGANAGPENATVLLADGFGKDNTQDISGVSYENFLFKTLLEEGVEGTKFCVKNPIGVPGGTGMKVYHDVFPRVGSAVVAAHDLQTTHIRALPVAEWSSGGFDGSKLVDSVVDAKMDNTGSHGYMYSGTINIWYGVLPVNDAVGCCPMVDLGADAEVGYVIIRGGWTNTAIAALSSTITSHGLKATLYKANAPTAPVAAASARTSGVTNLNVTVNVTTITASSGDFLGAITTGPLSNGVVTAGGNTFTATPGTFVAGDTGKILKITSVGDVGAYRITNVDVTGAILTVRSLNQLAYAWAASASSIVYGVWDGVREEDVLCIPSIAAPTQRLCIERLLTTTTAQVRVAPHTSLTGTSWQCAIPTWDKVKRISYSTEAQPPDVKANGTWVCEDGREQYNGTDWKIYADLTDLTTAQRTGRWWQLQMMPRFASNQITQDFQFSTFEFYSPAGVRLGVSQNTFSNNALQNADFMTQHINRMDFVQGAYNAMSGTANVNGLVDLGGAAGDTLTLTVPTDKFLGYQVRRPFSDGVCVAGAGGNFTSATAVFITADIGRILHIATGVNAGYYRIATRVSGTAVTLTLPSGTAASAFTGTTGETFTIHEGFSVGGVSPDRIVFLNDLTREYRLASINDAMTTLTIMEASQVAVTGKQWEIRRPGFDTAASAVDSTKLARLVRPTTTYPLQSGDIVHDSRGALRFWADDIGTGNSRADGSIAGGNGVFVGSGFCADDVGRLLYITTGVAANIGVWTISVFTSATSVTVVNAYTGAAVSFTADAAADKVYSIYGDRRFKITKQVTTLRA